MLIIYSLSFPKMFSANKTLLYENHEAIAKNIYLMLKSDRTALLGDPFYGTELKSAIYEQNNQIIKDLIIDEIYTCMRIFIPQVLLKREDITLSSDGADLYAQIKCTYYLDQVSDLYEINLTENQIDSYSN